VVKVLEHGLKLSDGMLSFHVLKPAKLTPRHKKFHDGFGCSGAPPRGRAKCIRGSSPSTILPEPAPRAPVLGPAMRVHPAFLVPDPKRTLSEGAFVSAAFNNNRDSWGGRMLHSLSVITALT
jgi:hypothetical protein